MLRIFTAAAALAVAAAMIAAPAVARKTPLAAGAATVQIKRGAMLYSSDGHRVANINSVVAGNAEIIFDGRIITVPSSTLSVVNGKLTTSLSKNEIRNR